MRFAALLLLGMCGTAFACPGLDVADGWIREAPPGATALAGYARLGNTGAHELRPDQLGSSVFGAIEIHRTVVEDGLSRMLRDQKLVLPPGGQAELAPGGWHLMLFRPQRPLPAGTVVEIAFTCGAATKSFPFTVRRE